MRRRRSTRRSEPPPTSPEGPDGGPRGGQAVEIYRKTADRSEVARLIIQARDYEAHVMEGGSEAWIAQGLRFTTPDDQPCRVT